MSQVALFDIYGELLPVAECWSSLPGGEVSALGVLGEEEDEGEELVGCLSWLFRGGGEENREDESFDRAESGLGRSRCGRSGGENHCERSEG